jgi:hypothetical protein
MQAEEADSPHPFNYPVYGSAGSEVNHCLSERRQSYIVVAAIYA